MQIEEHFQVIIKYLYNAKIVVAASTKAKEILTSKSLTPGLFVRPFYSDTAHVKPTFNVIDVEDYKKPSYKEYIDKAYNLLSGPLMNQRNIDKQHFDANTDVEDHINRQNFLWFLESAKLYLDTTSFEYNTTTIDQPFGIVQILSAGDNFEKDYQLVSEKTNQVIKESFILNPSQATKIQTLVLILINKEENHTIQDALKYTDILKKDFKVNGNFIQRLEINLPQSGQMHSFWLPCVKNSYQYKHQLKPGQKIYLFSPPVLQKLKKSTGDHQEVIILSINKRMEYLYKQFKDFSKATNKLKSLFSTSNSKQKYSNDEQDCRELGDLYFLFGQYKKAYDCYDELVGKFNDRNKRIYYYLLEMRTHCVVFAKKHGQWFKSDNYQHFEKDSKIILQNSQHFVKQAIFVVYSLYTLGTFKKDFIKGYFHQKVKEKTRQIQGIGIMTTLIQEQTATFHLIYNSSERRNYANSLLKVGMLFTQNKLQLNAFHCFKIIENIYKGSFSVIEIFVYTYLSKMCLQNGQFASAVLYLRKGWNGITNRITQQRYTQFVRNYDKLLNGIEDAKAGQYLKQAMIPLRFPIIKGLQLTLQDELCQQKISKMGTYNFNNPIQNEWVKMGQQYFGSDNITANIYKQQFKKLASFDAQSIEKKQIVHRVRVVIQNQQNIEKNTRVCFIGQQIKIQIYIYNPLFKQIQLTDCKIVLTSKKPNCEDDFRISPQSINIKIKGSTQKMIQFTVIPQEAGLYELTKFTWCFYKLFNQYQLPKYSNGSEKNYYFKFKVQQSVGKLRISHKIDDSVPFVGMIENISVALHNDGKQPIQDIAIIASDPRLFGFRIKKLDQTINNGEKIVQKFMIRIHSPDLISIRCLFIYKTGGLIRLKRFIVPLSPITIAEVKHLTCQKLSSHIHLLSFDVQKMQGVQLNKSLNLIDDNESNEFKMMQMILGQGFQILKVESTKSGNKIGYTFFLQKNPYAPSQKHLFVNSVQSDISIFKPYCQADQTQRRNKWQEFENKSYNYDHHQRMTILFVFSYEGKVGIFHPQRVSTNPKLLKILDKQSKLQDFLLPFDFKAKYQAQIVHNFNQNPVLEIDVQFKIKNIFTQKVMDLGIEFLDGDIKISPSDHLACGSWSGQTSYRLNLEKDQQAFLRLKFVVFENGIYDMSKIRYKLFKQKTKSPMVIMHNQFQNLFVSVAGTGMTLSKNIIQPVEDQIDLLG